MFFELTINCTNGKTFAEKMFHIFNLTIDIFYESILGSD